MANEGRRPECSEHTVFFKYSFSYAENFEEADLTHLFQPLKFESLPLTYPGGVPIPALKKKDLISLLPLLRDDASKAFYQALTEDDGVASHETDEYQEVEED